ncbi:hypothetical protein [Chrysiogenes arsenatis]|uniref:hypothetical protein n=1 Tax=Chrysiogenes arsenatis TaxID=309797 RepID=UPI000411045A|nr:hypothetical protein [Chrysiogenes arsenatis]
MKKIMLGMIFSVLIVVAGCAPKHPYSDAEIAHLLDLRHRLAHVEKRLDVLAARNEEDQMVLVHYGNAIKNVELQMAKFQGTILVDDFKYRHYSYHANPSLASLSFEPVLFQLIRDAALTDETGAIQLSWSAGRIFRSSKRVNGSFLVDSYYDAGEYSTPEKTLFVPEVALFPEIHE